MLHLCKVQWVWLVLFFFFLFISFIYLPSWLDCGYQVRTREHGEQAVPVGRGGFVTRAGRVALIG